MTTKETERVRGKEKINKFRDIWERKGTETNLNYKIQYILFKLQLKGINVSLSNKKVGILPF